MFLVWFGQYVCARQAMNQYRWGCAKEKFRTTSHWRLYKYFLVGQLHHVWGDIGNVSGIGENLAKSDIKRGYATNHGTPSLIVLYPKLSISNNFFSLAGGIPEYIDAWGQIAIRTEDAAAIYRENINRNIIAIKNSIVRDFINSIAAESFK